MKAVGRTKDGLKLAEWRVEKNARMAGADLSSRIAARDRSSIARAIRMWKVGSKKKTSIVRSRVASGSTDANQVDNHSVRYDSGSTLQVFWRTKKG